MTNFYILVGDEITWECAFKKNWWGFTDRTKGSWNTIEPGDKLVFYVTKPIKRAIGFGKVEKKFTNKTIFWPDEKLFNRIIWPYTLEFKTIHKISDWNKGIQIPKDIMLNQGRKKIDEKIFLELISDAKKTWNIEKI